MTGVVLKHALSERGNDIYETPACAVQALLRVENLPPRLWEPACCRGAIVNVLRAAGHELIGSDVVALLPPRLPAGAQAAGWLPSHRN